MFECFMPNARYVITVSLCWAVTVSPRAELGYHWCRHSENHPSLLPPSHLTTSTVLSSADTILSLPLICQRDFQLLTEPETGWERWCEVVGAGLSFLDSDWSVAAITLFWLADTELAWGRGRTWPELRLRCWGWGEERPHTTDQVALNAVSTLPHIGINPAWHHQWPYCHSLLRKFQDLWTTTMF